MAGKQLGRPTSKENWVKKNAVLMEMGSNYRIRLTSQSPVFYVKALCPFPDGSNRKSTGIYSREPDAVDRVFKLCLHLDDNPNALVEQKKTAAKPGYTGWRALSLELETHLRKLEIQDTHPDYWRHSRCLARFPGAVHPLVIEQWVESSPENSRERTRRLVTCNRLVEVGVELDRNWMDRIKSCNKYSPSTAIEPRTLPSDRQVEAFIDRLENRSWQVVFGYIATWGLRNHEVFRLHSLPDDEGLIEISDNSKTGFHVVAPAHPKWIERWNLRNFNLPGHNPESSHVVLGKAVSKYMQRHRPLAHWREEPKTYDLRHAWAARVHTHPDYSHIDVSVAAEMMGHAEKIHKATYLRWTKKEDLKRRLRQKLTTV